LLEAIIVTKNQNKLSVLIIRFEDQRCPLLLILSVSNCFNENLLLDKASLDKMRRS